jgi:uncharacterized membrane protein
MENKYVRALIYVVVGLAILVGLLFLGDVIADSSAAAQDSSAWGITFDSTAEDAQPAFKAGNLLGGWLPWVIIGALLLYLIYVFFADREMFKLGTTEVVMMGIGAALYGVLSWIFNIVPVPSVSLVALRPVVVIPIFFGFVFGPAVGFFTGAFGNILGDALSGWGVFPIWDFANGLIGFIPGLAGMYLRGRKTGADQSQLLQTLLWISAAVLAVAVVIPLVSPNVDFGDGPTDFGAWWYVMLVVLVVLLAVALAPQYWPYLLMLLTLAFVIFGVVHLVNPPEGLVEEGGSPVGGAVIMFVLALMAGVGAWYLRSRTQAISTWLDDTDTKALAIWGTVAVIVGIGFAAMADIFYNGYSFTTAFLGEFIPAAGPNILFAVILTPLLYAAYKQTRAQTGR